MEITAQLLAKWTPLMSYGDAKKIVENWSKVDGKAPHINTVRTALKTGKCSDKVLAGISRFYNQKLEKMKEVGNV